MMLHPREHLWPDLRALFGEKFVGFHPADGGLLYLEGGDLEVWIWRPSTARACRRAVRLQRRRRHR